MSSPKVWFITGCSSGFGAELALKALEADHKVIATSRNPSKTPELVSKVESLGGTWLSFDVCKDVPAVMAKATSIHGRIDVVINNAGYSILGAVEDFSEAECRDQMEVCFFAPLNIIKQVLPSMRARKSGTIVNISSVAGIDAQPSCGLYAASKHAMEAVSESLSKELVPFGVRVLLIEPGAFRTSFLGSYMTTKQELNPVYKGTPVDSTLQKFQTSNGKQLGNPIKGSEVIIDFIDGTGVGKDHEALLRLPLGSDCIGRIRVKAESYLQTIQKLEGVWSRTDFPS